VPAIIHSVEKPNVMRIFLPASIVFALLMTAAQAGAAGMLLTTSAGYTGPALTFLASQDTEYFYTSGPTALGGGITFTSTTPDGSSIGHGNVANDFYYGLADNGRAQNVITIGTESTGAEFITLTFNTAVQSFGALMNYARFSDGTVHANPTISAYDSANNLIASYDLDALAPIITPGGVDQFAFRGILSTGALIKSFRLGGSDIIATGTVEGAVPEPATWALMIVGFGLVGGSMRRRHAAAAIA